MVLIPKSIILRALQTLKNKILYLLLIDALFVVAVYGVNYILSSLFDVKNMLALIQQNNLLIFILMPFLFAYLLALLFVYTIFKYFVLEIIAEKESENKFHNILRLYSLNAKIFGGFFIVFAIINLIFFKIPDEYMLYFTIATMFPFIVLLTLFIDMLHANFIPQENNNNNNNNNNNTLRLKLVFQNKKFIIIKILLYASIILLYIGYNYLGTKGNLLLMPVTVFAIIYLYFLRKVEIIVSYRLVE